MPCRFLSLLLLNVGLLAAARGQDSDLQQRSLQQAFFKRPALSIADPQTPLTRPMVPAKRPAIPAPPPWLATAVRELSLQPTTLTPYDRYVGTVRAVFGRIESREPGMLEACELMKVANSFRYEAGDPYRASLPEVTATTRTGDCKAKALWIYERLGDPAALYVIGKISKDAKNNHAWLYWRCEERWWILDPTNRSEPIAADTVSHDRYLPHYSFGKGGAFRHRATQLFMAQTPAETPAVAARATRR